MCGSVPSKAVYAARGPAVAQELTGRGAFAVPDVRDQDGLHIGPDAVVPDDEAAAAIETAVRFVACIEAHPGGGQAAV